MSDNDSRYVDYKDTEDGHEDNVVEERIIQEENPEIGVSVGISYPILLIILAFILFAFVYNVVLSLTGEPIVAIVCAVVAVLAKKIYIYSIYYLPFNLSIPSRFNLSACKLGTATFKNC